ncbi:MAG TPA: sulfite reductase flavoprotein subunit alpha, partial [Methylophilaceae bacterium]|nr:sulfite reductase flavoprotein subunit alpha [Methylophilaceae bacterium]
MSNVEKSMAASYAENVFTESQWYEIQRLIGTLDSRQSLWLSGYLAALEKPFAANQEHSSSAAEVLIAFGSETGNSEKLARQLTALATEQGLQAVMKDLASLRARQLSKYHYVLLICSTHGDGDPPEPITTFYTSLMDEDAPRLPNMHYAVLSLGDSSYEHFCTTGKQLDERLASLGAARLAFRQDCDVDYAAPAKQWMDDVLKTLPRATSAAVSKPVAVVDKQTQYSKENPLTVKVLDNLCFSSDHRPDPIHHLELSLDVADFQLSPGDAVGVLAKNSATLVDAILKAANLPAEQTVSINHRSIALAQALAEECDLNIPSKNFLAMWAELSASAELAAMVHAESKEQRSFLRNHQIMDLISTYPAQASAQDFVASLRPLQPRLYDVANSLNLVDDELHLTVKQYSYPFRDRNETGVASDYLINLQKNSSLRIYPHRNARFHLPENLDAPLILIADGTGIAPYRAFMQEIEAGKR